MTKSYPIVYLKKGKEESLKRFHPWVFSGAIASGTGSLNEGDVVRVCTASGAFIAVGHYQIGSIAVRVLSFKDIVIDEEFWKSRLHSALEVRLALDVVDNPNNNTYRLVHGEGDNLPGLIVMEKLPLCKLIAWVCTVKEMPLLKHLLRC